MNRVELEPARVRNDAVQRDEGEFPLNAVEVGPGFNQAPRSSHESWPVGPGFNQAPRSPNASWPQPRREKERNRQLKKKRKKKHSKHSKMDLPSPVSEVHIKTMTAQKNPQTPTQSRMGSLGTYLTEQVNPSVSLHTRTTTTLSCTSDSEDSSLTERMRPTRQPSLGPLSSPRNLYVPPSQLHAQPQGNRRKPQSRSKEKKRLTDLEFALEMESAARKAKQIEKQQETSLVQKNVDYVQLRKLLDEYASNPTKADRRRLNRLLDAAGEERRASDRSLASSRSSSFRSAENVGSGVSPSGRSAMSAPSIVMSEKDIYAALELAQGSSVLVEPKYGVKKDKDPYKRETLDAALSPSGRSSKSAPSIVVSEKEIYAALDLAQGSPVLAESKYRVKEGMDPLKRETLEACGHEEFVRLPLKSAMPRKNVEVAIDFQAKEIEADALSGSGRGHHWEAEERKDASDLLMTPRSSASRRSRQSKQQHGQDSMVYSPTSPSSRSSRSIQGVSRNTSSGDTPKRHRSNRALAYPESGDSPRAEERKDEQDGSDLLMTPRSSASRRSRHSKQQHGQDLSLVYSPTTPSSRSSKSMKSAHNTSSGDTPRQHRSNRALVFSENQDSPRRQRSNRAVAYPERGDSPRRHRSDQTDHTSRHTGSGDTLRRHESEPTAPTSSIVIDEKEIYAALELSQGSRILSEAASVTNLDRYKKEVLRVFGDDVLGAEGGGGGEEEFVSVPLKSAVPRRADSLHSLHEPEGNPKSGDDPEQDRKHKPEGNLKTEGIPWARVIFDGNSKPESKPRSRGIFDGNSKPESKPRSGGIFDGNSRPKSKPRSRGIFDANARPKSKPRSRGIFDGNTRPKSKPRSRGIFDDNNDTQSNRVRIGCPLPRRIRRAIRRGRKSTTK